MQTQLKLGRTGKWELHYSERLDTGRWRSRTVSTRETDRGKAESFRQVFEAQMTQAAVAAKGATVSQCIDEYLRKPKFKTRLSSDKTMLQMEQIRRGLGSLAVTDLNSAVMASYIQKNKWSDGTARRVVAQVVSVLRHAQKMRLIKTDDIPHLERPDPVPPRDKWLDETQEAEFYALALGFSMGRARLSKITRFVCIALDTGQRRGAIIPLKWSQVDLQKGLIDFRMKGATNKRQGIVPINSRLRPLLERAHRERVSEYVLDSPGEIVSQYQHFVETRGFKWVTPHVLRHTAATLMLRAGVTIWEVAGVLGNSPAMVERVYGHHAPDHLRNAVGKRFE